MENTNNQNVFELAITLGKALKQDERLVRMDNARKAYEEIGRASCRERVSPRV